MPELPDITVYIEALEERLTGQRLVGIHIGAAFLLRTVAPRPEEFIGREVRALARLGKRIAIGFNEDLWMVFHLMIAGRLHWDARGATVRRRAAARLEFGVGTLTLTEAGTKKRAALHCVRGAAALRAHDPGGIEPLTADLGAFATALTRENHTLKRALTDPSILSGIGNAYSDEILHRARLSPVLLTASLNREQIERLYDATRTTLEEWLQRLRAERRGDFPERVTAFREGMAVHGRYGQPCPSCGTAVQRIRYASNETDYCPRCQTDGRLLADRSLSRLLKRDWPRTIDELEKRKR